MARQNNKTGRIGNSGKATAGTTSAAAQAEGPGHVQKQAGSPAAAPGKAEVIHLGIDVHKRLHVVCRKVDGATPQPAQKFTPAAFKAWVQKQQALAVRVVCCYEAGPFGYTLQRELTALGVTCHVVRPQDWDRYGQNVKTDGRDARELAEALARYEAGNQKALDIVKVPEPEQERKRAISRQRTTLVNEVRRLGAIGRSNALSQGFEMDGRWWRKGPWSKWLKRLPDWLADLLRPIQATLVQLEVFIEERTTRIEAGARPATQRPKGLGALTEQIISDEVLDWKRFNNRRQVGSYTGLCPSEHTTGGNRRQGSINKHGNPRLRHALVEAVWRFIRLQPGWIRLEKIKARLLAAGTDAGRAPVKKKLVVALARELAVDLWRLNTGRCTLADLGLEPAAQAA